MIGYSYNDISIVPSVTSRVNTRSSVFIDSLPIYTAPMSTIVDSVNPYKYECNNITPIVPRNIDINIRLNLAEQYWIAVSLKEAEEHFLKNTFNNYVAICIDVANGHMDWLLSVCEQLKKKYGDVIRIMTGNIANPNTLLSYINAGIDAVRLGIGSGSGCITSSNLGIHYPMASLIQECYKIKRRTNSNITLIADGGVRNYSDVIKALALGADKVMIGGLFATLEDIIPENIYIKGGKQYRKFYGMASKEGQKDLNKQVFTTAEGLVKEVEVNGTLHQWSKNMLDYLKSAMSYCNAFTLSEFIGKPEIIINSIGTLNSVNK